MPETVKQKMIKQGRIRPDGRNWRGQCAFFKISLKSGPEMPAGMTSDEAKKYLFENYGVR